MFFLPRDLLFDQLHRMLVRVALDVQAIPHDFDNRPGVLMNQVSHIQRVLLRVGLHRLDLPALAGW